MIRFKTRIMQRFPIVFVAVMFLSMARSTPLTAAIIFESGTLGPTGVPQGSVAATNITASVYTGVRFQLTQPVLTTQIGGHFVDRNNGTFFGAIVALDDGNDFPDSGDLSTDDVLGTTVLTFPVPSAEVFSDLSVFLEPGWYALIFGSGLLGASGDGAASQSNPDIGNPAYIGFQPGFGVGWVDLTGLPSTFENHRFVVKGQIVPEPSALTITLLAFLSFAFWKTVRQ